MRAPTGSVLHIEIWMKAKNPENLLRVFIEKLAATYSRRTYRTTTIGKTVFDGRVRNGIGSDHSFMATKNRERKQWRVKDPSELHLN